MQINVEIIKSPVVLRPSMFLLLFKFVVCGRNAVS